MKRRLTERIIESLKTDRNQEDVFHVLTPSAGIRLTREGRKTWFVLYRSPSQLDGTGEPKARRYYFGEHRSGKAGQGTYLTLEEFRKAYDIFRGLLAKGIDPQEPLPTTGENRSHAVPPEPASSPSLVFSRKEERLDEPSRLETAPEWLQAAFPNGYRHGTLGHRFCQYFEAAKDGNGTRRLAPRTLARYISTTRTHLVKRFGMRPATSISQDCIADLFSELVATSPQMVRQVKKVLSGVYEFCRANVREMRRFPNPTLGIRIAVPKGKRDRWLNDEELRTLLGGLEQLKDDKARDVYTLILASGCRPGEAAGLDAEDIISFGGERVWRVRFKVDRDHLIPLVGPIAEIINRRYMECGGQGPLFWASVTKKTDYADPLRRANREIRQLTGIKNYRPNDNRRTMRTHIESLGVRPEVGEALLNHQKGEIEGTYALYTYWKERKEALRLWHEKLNGLQRDVKEEAA
jgi:integrase